MAFAYFTSRSGIFSQSLFANRISSDRSLLSNLPRSYTRFLSVLISAIILEYISSTLSYFFLLCLDSSSADFPPVIAFNCPSNLAAFFNARSRSRLDAATASANRTTRASNSSLSESCAIFCEILRMVVRKSRYLSLMILYAVSKRPVFGINDDTFNFLSVSVISTMPRTRSLYDAKDT